MCLHKRYILNAVGKSVYVPCGHCEACLQAKAINRTNRIRNNESRDGSQLTLFVTLTYRNDSVPYFHYEDLMSAVPDECGDITVPIYRDAKTYFKRIDGDYNFERVVTHDLQELCTVSFPESYRLGSFNYLSNSHSDKIGVLYYKDVQNYIKRVRRRLEYQTGNNVPFTYFSCSEYGPTTCRPHFHLLFFIPKALYSLFASILNEAWSFDDYDPKRPRVEIARNASAYVSSYVNSSTVVPSLFKYTSEFKQKHSYSQGFGLASECFSLSQVSQAVHQRDLHYDCTVFRDGVPTVERYLFPKYVINRYFPKFKGHCRLSFNDLINIYSRPECLVQYAKKCELTSDDIHKWTVHLTNKLKRAIRSGMSVIDYAFTAASAWSVRSLNSLRDWYSNLLTPNDYLTAYDNILNYFIPLSGRSRIKSPSLDSLNLPFDKSCPERYNFDPNFFPENIRLHNTLTASYYSYQKDRHVRNMAYTSCGFNF